MNEILCSYDEDGMMQFIQQEDFSGEYNIEQIKRKTNIG